MSQTIQAKEITLQELKSIFHLELSEDEQFFPEWQDNLPPLADWQKQQLDRVKKGFLNLIENPPLLEKAINMTIVSPLLFIGEFYLQPFFIKPEKSVAVMTEDEGTIIKGSINTLVLKEKLWLMVIESKRASLSIETALPQILAYLLASANDHKPNYGMITNGGSFMFIKLLKQDVPRYATSDLFGITNRTNNLYDVLQILKHLAQIVMS